MGMKGLILSVGYLARKIGNSDNVLGSINLFYKAGLKDSLPQIKHIFRLPTLCYRCVPQTEE